MWGVGGGCLGGCVRAHACARTQLYVCVCLHVCVCVCVRERESACMS